MAEEQYVLRLVWTSNLVTSLRLSPGMPHMLRNPHSSRQTDGCFQAGCSVQSFAQAFLAAAARSLCTARCARKAKDRNAADLGWVEKPTSRQRHLRREEYSLIRVPVRGGAGLGGACTLALKRFSAPPLPGGLPRSRPAVLIVHDGPGLPSRYLEPFAGQISARGGRTCFLYDQLGCGMSHCKTPFDPGGLGLQQSVEDLQAVLKFLFNDLSEHEVHIAGHGFGGSLIMEALLRGGLYRYAGHEKDFSNSLPRLRSVLLVSSTSSMSLAEAQAQHFMKTTEQAVGSEAAPHSFWCRHICAVYPQPAALKDAYLQAGDRTNGWWCTGALQGWKPCKHDGCSCDWELQGSAPLEAWEITEQELRENWANSTGSAPVLSIRGEYDFISEDCVKAWRALAESGASKDASPAFLEDIVAGSGHHPHFDSPRVFAEKICGWLKQTEEQASEKFDSESGEPELSMDCRMLAREDARRHLVSWASSLSRASPDARERWAFHWRLHVADRYWLSPSPAREARRLADWARELPVALDTCRDRDRLPPVRSSRAAIGMAVPDGRADLEAIVCIERTCALHGGGSCFTVVGAAAAPEAAENIRDSAVRQVRQLIAERSN